MLQSRRRCLKPKIKTPLQVVNPSRACAFLMLTSQHSVWCVIDAQQIKGGKEEEKERDNPRQN